MEAERTPNPFRRITSARSQGAFGNRSASGRTLITRNTDMSETMNKELMALFVMSDGKYETTTGKTIRFARPVQTRISWMSAIAEKYFLDNAIGIQSVHSEKKFRRRYDATVHTHKTVLTAVFL